MQRSVFEGWIGGLNERGFDAPFLALLRSHRFYDIHFTHGSYEFGKDFLAKRLENEVPTQFAFQSKAGDIGGGEWDAIFSQLFEATGGRLTHPNFDPAAPRRCVLVTTGRLKGKAIQSANDFRSRVAADAAFSVWDQDYLLDLARGTNPEFPLWDPHPAIEQVVAQIQLGTLGSRTLLLGLERALPSLPLSTADLNRASVEATLVIAALRRAGMHLHVPLVAAHLARLAAATEESGAGATAYGEALALHGAAVDELVIMFGPAMSAPSDFMGVVGGGLEHWFTYPAACLLLGEAVADAALRTRRTDPSAHRRYLDLLLALVHHQAGVQHPPSDRYAVSTFAVLAALADAGEWDAVSVLLRATTLWLCERLDEEGVGLAGPYAEPQEEVDHLLGGHLEHLQIERNGDSLLATVLIEAAAAWCPSLYSDVLNDVLAVGATPSTVVPLRLPDGLFLTLGGTGAVVNGEYSEPPEPRAWHTAEVRLPAHVDRVEAGFLFASTCRDRLFQAAAFRHIPGRPI